MMKVDLLVQASTDDRAVGTTMCVFLPAEASTVTATRYPLVAEAGSDRPLWMTIQAYISTVPPLIERVNVRETLSLTIPELGSETCFSFENVVAPRQAQSVAQAYKYFAQVVSIEVR